MKTVSKSFQNKKTYEDVKEKKDERTLPSICQRELRVQVSNVVPPGANKCLLIHVEQNQLIDQMSCFSWNKKYKKASVKNISQYCGHLAEKQWQQFPAKAEISCC